LFESSWYGSRKIHDRHLFYGYPFLTDILLLTKTFFSYGYSWHIHLMDTPDGCPWWKPLQILLIKTPWRVTPGGYPLTDTPAKYHSYQIPLTDAPWQIHFDWYHWWIQLMDRDTLDVYPWRISLIGIVAKIIILKIIFFCTMTRTKSRNWKSKEKIKVTLQI